VLIDSTGRIKNFGSLPFSVGSGLELLVFLERFSMVVMAIDGLTSLF
jgi:hypothetical protein